MEQKNNCPCNNRGCHHHLSCVPCKEYHHGRGSTTACERLKSDDTRTQALRVTRFSAFRTATP